MIGTPGEETEPCVWMTCLKAAISRIAARKAAAAVSAVCRWVAADWASAPWWCWGWSAGRSASIRGCSSGGPSSSPAPAIKPRSRRPPQTGAPRDETGRDVAKILGSTEVVWKDIFAKDGKSYRAPTLVMYTGSTEARCGAAQSAMGPFYCPNDEKVYLDAS